MTINQINYGVETAILVVLFLIVSAFGIGYHYGKVNQPKPEYFQLLVCGVEDNIPLYPNQVPYKVVAAYYPCTISLKETK